MPVPAYANPAGRIFGLGVNSGLRLKVFFGPDLLQNNNTLLTQTSVSTWGTPSDIASKKPADMSFTSLDPGTQRAAVPMFYRLERIEDWQLEIQRDQLSNASSEASGGSTGASSLFGRSLDEPAHDRENGYRKLRGSAFFEASRLEERSPVHI